MSKIKKTLIILFVTMGLASCDVLTQIAQMANFANCTFDFNSVNQIQMLEVNLSKGMSKNDLNSVVTIPITTDLFQLFSGESADAIVNLAFKLAGASSEPVNVGLKVKPYISVNNQQLAYPDYITMNKVLN